MGLASKLKNSQSVPAMRSEPMPGQYPTQTRYGSLQEESRYDSLNYNSQYESLGNASAFQPSAPLATAVQPSAPAPIPIPSQYRPPPQRHRPDMNKVQNHIYNIIKANRIEQFYPQEKLKGFFERISTIDFESLAAQWKIGVDMAYDFCVLGLYDIAVFVDDSGSMRFEDNGARIPELGRILARIAQITTLFDQDGILIRFMNNAAEGNGICNASEADQLLSRVNFSGMTPMGTNLEKKVLEPFVFEPIRNGTFTKPVLVYVITDGDPSGEAPNKIIDVIAHTKLMLQRANLGKAVAFEFAQVGRDMAAQQFLSKLDNDHSIGDVVDTTSYYELEAEEYAKKGVDLSPELWTLKLMLGAVDPSYDEQDE